eukprot:CAMPEP_0194103084 /NCGR_PEP_ID=MMETSP0150-20130528/3601_1 /TAXON_ID=122233 /ORGANISM="Chaetoceros debilis, Strain MM31A-1" /LENGTH=192 /DNA_ID=CAMNT_0038790235 /DNA_START=75 /DNA_END=649 /DNA_ORIENTATION=-
MREYKARGALSGRIYIALFTIFLFSCFNIFIGRNGFHDYTATDTINSAYTIIFGDDNDDVSYNANSSVSNNFEHEKNENEDGIDNADGNVNTITTTDNNVNDVKENNAIDRDGSDVKTGTTADNDNGDVKENNGIDNDDGNVGVVAENDDDGGVDGLAYDDDDAVDYAMKDGRKRMNVLILYPDDWRHNTIG